MAKFPKLANDEDALETMEYSFDNGSIFTQALVECFNPSYLAGAVASASVGLLAIYIVMGAVRRGKLEYFLHLTLGKQSVDVPHFSSIITARIQ